jgi:soluble lytic murein transglycosylase-like protein
MAASSDDNRPKTDPEPRRRADDSVATAPEPGKLTAREIFQKMRRPMIGLGMIGAAVPMVNASSADPNAQPPEEAEAQPGTHIQTAAVTGADTEEHIATQIATTRADQAREQNVTEAMSKYDIERELAEDIYDIAREQNIDPQLAYGLVRTESTFDERAKSHVGARGLTQVMPRTAAWLVPGTKTEDLYDRQTNLRLGFKYLDQLIDKYKGDVRLALLAYNRGPGTVDKVLKRGGDPNNGYADKVLRG